MQTKAQSGCPANINELVQFIGTAVQAHFEKSGRPMDGSQLAYLIRTEFPSLEYRKLGLTRLGDAVRIAECENKVRRNREAQHLELSPPDVEQPSARTGENAPKNRLYVRGDVWDAFVHTSRPVQYLDTKNNKIETQPADSAKEEGDKQREVSMVEIRPIPETTKIAWAKDFLSIALGDTKFSDANARSLAAGQTAELDSATRRSWKLAFADHVVQYIQAWADEKRVQTTDFLTPIKSKEELTAAKSKAGDSDEIQLLRSAIAAAVNEMQIEDLENLKLPVRLIRRHFRPK